MPEGTPVCAARGGVVVKVEGRLGSRRRAASNTTSINNYLMIRHDDGTLGHYCHLQKDGATVKVGQRVEAGEIIARSGNTGFSSGPHLHFAVIKPRNGRGEGKSAGAVPDDEPGRDDAGERRDLRGAGECPGSGSSGSGGKGRRHGRERRGGFSNSIAPSAPAIVPDMAFFGALERPAKSEDGAQQEAGVFPARNRGAIFGQRW